MLLPVERLGVELCTDLFVVVVVLEGVVAFVAEPVDLVEFIVFVVVVVLEGVTSVLTVLLGFAVRHIPLTEVRLGVVGLTLIAPLPCLRSTIVAGSLLTDGRETTAEFAFKLPLGLVYLSPEPGRPPPPGAAGAPPMLPGLPALPL